MNARTLRQRILRLQRLNAEHRSDIRTLEILRLQRLYAEARGGAR
jgi:hypothetical protein